MCSHSRNNSFEHRSRNANISTTVYVKKCDPKSVQMAEGIDGIYLFVSFYSFFVYIKKIIRPCTPHFP